MSIRISNETAYEMLENRLDQALEWWSSMEYKDMFMEMYQYGIENGKYECEDFDPMIIVDNDVVNYCRVIDKDDERYEKLINTYNKNEYYNEELRLQIEVVDEANKRILIRY